MGKLESGTKIRQKAANFEPGTGLRRSASNERMGLHPQIERTGMATVSSNGSVQIIAIDPGVNNRPGLRLSGVPLTIPGFGPKLLGITFQTGAEQVNGVMGSGTHSWVQVISSDYLQIRNPSVSGNAKGGVQTCINLVGPLLDTNYPYGSRSLATQYSTAVDSPDISLPAAWAEEQRLFRATMYLTWDPTLPGPGQQACSAAFSVYSDATNQTTSQASTCTGSIPIPLASVSWTAAGDAINTLQNQAANGTTFVLNGGPATNAGCVVAKPNTDPNASFPTWGNLYQPQPNCQ